MELLSRETGLVGELEHRYGSQVHILDNLYLSSALARLSSRDADRQEVTAVVRTLYRALMISVVGREFPRIESRVATRMAEEHPAEAYYRGPLLDPSCRVVIVDVIRGGILPAQVCFEMLEPVLPEENVRQDHLIMSRRTDDVGRVVGVDLHGSKVGGTVDGAIVLIPDPMGATGSTTIGAVRHYLEGFGKPRRIVAMPMIGTPEYLRALKDSYPEIIVYTLRVDRGLSSMEILQTVPGTAWDEERGLNNKGYIVPGAGGIGEILSNSWC